MFKYMADFEFAPKNKVQIAKNRGKLGKYII